MRSFMIFIEYSVSTFEYTQRILFNAKEYNPPNTHNWAIESVYALWGFAYSKEFEEEVY